MWAAEAVGRWRSALPNVTGRTPAEGLAAGGVRRKAGVACGEGPLEAGVAREEGFSEAGVAREEGRKVTGVSGWQGCTHTPRSS